MSSVRTSILIAQFDFFFDMVVYRVFVLLHTILTDEFLRQFREKRILPELETDPQ
jgi:hypothetical protein